jgi:uncharacterized cupredoxin-like copper-binding protein
LFDLGRIGLIATSLVGSLVLGVGSPVANAQDATPSPMGECVPGTMSTEVIASPEASPAAEEATPAEEPVGSPADEATVEAANAFIANMAACAGNVEALATLVTANLVNAFGGYESVEAALADGFFEDVPSGAEVSDVTSYDDGSVGVAVSYQQTEYQVVSEEWSLVQEGDEWKLNAIGAGPRLDLEGDTAAVGVKLGEAGDGTYTITPNATSVVATDVLIFQAINMEGNVEPHELVVVKLPEGADPAGLFDGSVKEEDIEFIGQVAVIEPGTSADMYLVNLPAGVYTLLCFFPNPDGEPHAAHGMVAQFEVTAPAT